MRSRRIRVVGKTNGSGMTGQSISITDAETGDSIVCTGVELNITPNNLVQATLKGVRIMELDVETEAKIHAKCQFCKQGFTPSREEVEKAYLLLASSQDKGDIDVVKALKWILGKEN